MVVPAELQPELLHEAHRKVSGHVAEKKICETVRKHYWSKGNERGYQENTADLALNVLPGEVLEKLYDPHYKVFLLVDHSIGLGSTFYN